MSTSKSKLLDPFLHPPKCLERNFLFLLREEVAERAEYSRLLKMYWIFCRERQFQLQREKQRQFGRWWTNAFMIFLPILWDLTAAWIGRTTSFGERKLESGPHDTACPINTVTALFWLHSGRVEKRQRNQYEGNDGTYQILLKVDKKGRGPYGWGFHWMDDSIEWLERESRNRYSTSEGKQTEN